MLIREGMKDRRSLTDIYYDVLQSIINNSYRSKLGITNVQQSAGVSFDKISRYLKEMERLKIITLKPHISITPRGRNYIRDVAKIQEITEKTMSPYFKEEEMIGDNKHDSSQLIENLKTIRRELSNIENSIMMQENNILKK